MKGPFISSDLKITGMKILFLATLSLYAATLCGQATGNGVSSSTTRRMETYSWMARPDENEDLSVQKLFMDQKWMPGHVRFSSGRADMYVPLIFDDYNNMLYYRQGQVIMEFVDSVHQFSLRVPYLKDSATLLFRNHYPAIQANTKETFYEVLVDGKIQLLKCRAKTVQLFRENDLPEERRDELKKLYFIFLPDGSLHLAPLDMDRLKQELPAYAAQMEEVRKKHHIRLKNEEKLADLIVHLNNALQ